VSKSVPNSEPARVRPIVPLLPYQREDIECDARFRWNCWARQTGKSFTKSLRRILRGLRRGRSQIFLSAGERQSRELMDKARQHCQALKIAFDYYDDRWFADMSVKQLEIRLPNRVRIIGLPANPQTARGFSGDVLLDEFAMHAFDREIWAAMFPTVLRGGGELDIASTPKGRQNMFYRLRDNERFSTSTLTLPQAIEQGLDVDLDEIRRAMGDEELFRQELLCEFLDESTAFLTYDQITACMDPALSVSDSVMSLSRETGELFMGVDVGRRRDLTVLWVLSPSRTLQPARSSERWATPDGEIFVTVALFELANAPFRVQFDLLAELLSLPRVRRCCLDAGGLGMPLAEQCIERFGGHRVEAVTFTPALKSQLASALRIAVENRRIVIPSDERIRNEWHSLTRTVTESGHFRLDAPRQEGSHADRFWAAALALHAADVPSGNIEALETRPLHFARTGTW